MKIVTAGDNCMDVYKTLGKFYPGGNPVNVAVYMSKLGAEAAYVGCIGNDEYGELMIDAVKSKDVDVSHLHKIDGHTAVTEVELVNHDRVFGDYYEGVLENFKLTEEDKKFIKGFPMIHTGIWGKMESYLDEFQKEGILVAFDFADKLDHEIVKKALPHVSYAFFSYTRSDDFIKNYIKKAQEEGPKVVIATLGDNGSIAYDGNRFYEMGIIPVEVVDTMGAGDSYIAGYLFSVLKGKSIEDCMTAGAKNASRNITYFGAW